MADVAGRRTVVVLMGSALVIGAAWSIGPFLFEKRDVATALDSRAVREEAGAACAQMQDGVDAAGDAEAQNRAVEAMVARIRDLGPETLDKDKPAETWLADWESLIAARRATMASDGSYDVPRRDGARITRYMDDLVKDLRPCTVPEALLPPRGF